MSVSETDYGALRRRRRGGGSRRLARDPAPAGQGGKASSSTGRPVRHGRRLRGQAGRTADLALRRPRRGDGRGARARSPVLLLLPPALGGDDPLAPPPVLELPAPDSSPYADMQPDRRTTLRRMAALFRLSQGFRAAGGRHVRGGSVPAGRAARAVRCALRGDHRRHDDRSRGDDPGAVAGRLLTDTRRRGSCGDVRGTRVGDRSVPASSTATRSASSCSATRSNRSASTTRPRSGRCARWMPCTCTRCARRSRHGGRRPARQDPGRCGTRPCTRSSKTRHLLEQIDDGELFFGIESLAPAFHRRMASLFDYLPDDVLCVVEDPGAVLDQARRQATRLREAAGDPARRASSGVARDGLRPGRGRSFRDRRAGAGRKRLEIRLIEVSGRDDGDGGEEEVPRVRIEGVAPHDVAGRAGKRRARAGHGREGGPGGRGVSLREKIRAWMELGHRVRLVAPSRSHADRLLGPAARAGFAGSARAGRRNTHDLSPGAPTRRWRCCPARLRRGFVLPADHLVVVAEEEIFGARSLRESRPAGKTAWGLGDLRRDRRGRLHRPRRARDRPLPRG